MIVHPQLQIMNSHIGLHEGYVHVGLSYGPVRSPDGSVGQPYVVGLIQNEWLNIGATFILDDLFVMSALLKPL